MRDSVASLVYMAASALAFSLMSLFVKLAAFASLPSFEIVIARSLIQLYLSLGYLYIFCSVNPFTGDPLRPQTGISLP
ncbi:MAG: hypothetical protein SGCHY_005327, partial [Lobulomycetales sp.]